MRQQRALAVMKANSTYGYIRKIIAQRSQQVIIPFSHLQSHVHLFCFHVPSTREIHKPEGGYLQLKANRIIISFILLFYLYIF